MTYFRSNHLAISLAHKNNLDNMDIFLICNSGWWVYTLWVYISFKFEYNINVKVIILAYSGNLLSSLTLPVRSKALNTFKDLLQMPEDGAVIVKQHTSMHAIFQGATDPLLKVITYKSRSYFYSFSSSTVSIDFSQ